MQAYTHSTVIVHVREYCMLTCGYLLVLVKINKSEQTAVHWTQSTVKCMSGSRESAYLAYRSYIGGLFPSWSGLLFLSCN